MSNEPSVSDASEEEIKAQVSNAAWDANQALRQDGPHVEFRCPTCGSDGYSTATSNRTVQITCTGCSSSWTPKDYWKAHVVVRRCINKTDYDYYQSLTEDSYA